MDESTSSTESIKAAQPEARIGSYRVLNPLGSGGMSSVFRAVHIETNQEVALKVLTRSLAKNATLLQRFLREARSAETLEHANIVAIYDRGIDSGRHYLVLEFVAGGDLHDYIQRQGPLSLAEANSIVKSVAAGLKYAANRGLIHRDVKPSNILRTHGGEIKIIDLGLALQNEFEDERVTRDGTTVGTVDYMAPEQARDSRATSIQSDMYSLGCTFYYLLAGVAPFPGGDITDKLTRHAKNPPPDIRDLRPDLPVELSAILLKLMAKRPDDRFASYDELTAAIVAVPLAGGTEPPGVTFAPVADSADAAAAGYGFGLGVTQVHASGGSHGNGSADASIPLVSLAELAAEQDLPPTVREQPATRHISYLGSNSGSNSNELVEPATSKPSRGSFPATAWILPGAILFLAFVILGIGVAQFMGPHESGNADAAGQNGLVAEESLDRDTEASLRGAVSAGRRPSAVERRRVLPVNVQATAPPKVKWDEPRDVDTPATGAQQTDSPPAAAAKYLPDWARSPVPGHIDGPFVAVRRITDSDDPSIVSSLHRALDDHIGGTVELADEGPLPVEDFRLAGATRLIRARKGFRPIVRLERASQDAVRRQQGVLVLKGKSLILDGIDLVVDMRELSRTQTALFVCAGANLTLSNCSITILNHAANIPLSLIRAEAAALPTHIRLEGCLVRGALTDGFRINGGPCEVVLRDSVFLAGGGPLVRVDGADATSDSRIFLVRSLVAGPGPIVESTAKSAGGPSKPLVIRAFSSVFGRLHGSGIASVISSSDTNQPPGKQIDWSGDANLFAGWKGFFACGDDRTVTVYDLAAARSTWNGTDLSSREILAPWAHPGDLAGARPSDFSSFAPSHLAILQRAARPRAGLYEKAVAAYSEPAVPQPAEWTFQGIEQPLKNNAPGRDGLVRADMAEWRRTDGGFARAAGSNAALELTFKTDAAPWRGDLGAFLRDRLSPALNFVRVRVVGSGPHRFTPVKLPRGLRLEIMIESIFQATPPTWSPAEGATGTALIELQGGALVLSNLILRPEPSARLEHLIHVEDGHLVLANCQLAVPTSPDVTGDLIAFRSATTEPQPLYLDQPLFSFPIDRPVCRLAGCVLITGGRALQAELGRGLVALSQCALAAGGPAIELKPANVARRRFDADLVLDHCTLTSDRTIVRVDSWPGLAPGPDRPWLISSRNCAFLSPNGGSSRQTLLLRCDADALANGTVCWQADDDAAEVDWFITVGEASPPFNRSREVQQQWVQFWGRNHMGRVTGPRGTASQPSVRFRDRLRSGQEIVPADLVLDPSHHPDRPELSVGADLSRSGRVPAAAAGRQEAATPY
jgi:serine/threonine protein kinase